MCLLKSVSIIYQGKPDNVESVRKKNCLLSVFASSMSKVMTTINDLKMSLFLAKSDNEVNEKGEKTYIEVGTCLTALELTWHFKYLP